MWHSLLVPFPIHDRGLGPKTWHESCVRAYLERDVRQLINVWDLGTFRRFTRICVDLLVDHGTDLSATEIKSGQTINGDYFRGLEFWRNLAGEAAGQLWLVYGGDNRQVCSNVTVLPWHEMLPEQVVNEHNAHA